MTFIFEALRDSIEAVQLLGTRIDLEEDPEARKIMALTRDNEFRHVGMALEYILRNEPRWRDILKTILFSEEKDITDTAYISPRVLILEEEPEPVDPEQLMNDFLAN